MEKLGDLFSPVLTLKQDLPTGRRDAVRAHPTTRLRFIEPMHARLAAELPEGSEWQYELKFDGYRALAMKTWGELRLLSRNGRPLNSQFPKVAAALEGLSEGT